tara:strand:- start:1005 stop:2102 length:1098 start_codon:yes stop_codon:yes gene_type:complete
MLEISRPIHGSINLNELRLLGLKHDNILDFSANINPLGTPTSVCEAIKNVELDIYPDPDCLEIREAISKNISTPLSKIPIEKIFIGNGSNEILHLLSRIILSKKSTALIMAPTYGEYEFAFRISGADVINFNADFSKDFRWDFRDVSNLIKARKPQIVMICNPNNPTGLYCKQNDIETLAKTSIESGSILVVDQAYLSFVEKPWDSLFLLNYSNTILVRSMSKDYAQTALRLGYALASENMVSKFRSIQPDWSVNSLAQKAGISAINDIEYLSKARETVFSSKQFLKKELTNLGLETVTSDANFILIKVNNGNKWRSSLLKKGIVVRDCSSFGLPNYIRVGIRKIDDCKIFVEAINDLLPFVKTK